MKIQLNKINDKKYYRYKKPTSTDTAIIKNNMMSNIDVSLNELKDVVINYCYVPAKTDKKGLKKDNIVSSELICIDIDEFKYKGTVKAFIKELYNKFGLMSNIGYYTMTS